MAAYTTNYGLHQWESTDNFLRTDFNADHQLIDAALAGLEGERHGWHLDGIQEMERTAR